MTQTKLIIFCLILLSAVSHAQTTLENLLEPIWKLTLLDASTNNLMRREYAGYITLNTATNEYGIDSVVPGRWTLPGVGARVTVPDRPPDIPANPTPLDKPIYYVAWFHTHTPTTHVTFPHRPVGPSVEDYGISRDPRVNVPGFVVDFVAVQTNNIPPNSIPAGLSTNAPFMIYDISPPSRRPLP